MARRPPRSKNEEMQWVIDQLRREWFDAVFVQKEDKSLLTFIMDIIRYADKNHLDLKTDADLIVVLDSLTEDRRRRSEEREKEAAAQKEAEMRKTHTYAVVCDYWTESESGWGQRPDGCSLHLTEEDYKAYVKDYWAEERKRNPSGAVPAEYSRPDENTFIALVDQETYKQIKDSKNGVRKWQSYEVMKATKDDLLKRVNTSQ